MKKEIYWKHHGSEYIECFAPYEIIEFIYKHQSKVLRIDSKNWDSMRLKIIDYIKSHWDDIKTSINEIECTIEIK